GQRLCRDTVIKRCRRGAWNAEHSQLLDMVLDRCRVPARPASDDKGADLDPHTVGPVLCEAIKLKQHGILYPWSMWSELRRARSAASCRRCDRAARAKIR